MSISGLSQFTVSNSAKTARDSKITKLKDNKDLRAEASGKKNEIIENVKDAAASVPLPNRPVTPDQVDRVMALADEGSTGSNSGKKRGRPPGKSGSEASSSSGSTKKRSEAIKKYAAFYRNQHLNKYCDKIAPSDHWDEATAIGALARVRSNINRNSAQDWTVYILRFGFMGLERGINHGYIPNVFQWDLQPNPVTGETLAQSFMRQYREDPELQELAAELGAEFGLIAEAGLAQRAFTKLFGVAATHSEDNHTKRVRIDDAVPK